MTRVALSLLIFAATLGTSAARSADCDGSRGASVFADKCATCHSLDEEPGKMGPSLRGVVGRLPGQLKGFGYSSGIAALSSAWSPATLDWFLADPTTRVPGTYMAFGGIRRAGDRADVICFLAQNGASKK